MEKDRWDFHVCKFHAVSFPFKVSYYIKELNPDIIVQPTYFLTQPYNLGEVKQLVVRKNDSRNIIFFNLIQFKKLK